MNKYYYFTCSSVFHNLIPKAVPLGHNLKSKLSGGIISDQAGASTPNNLSPKLA
jgi:hypothetical protein